MTTLYEAAQQALDILDSEFTTVDGEFCRWCDGRLNAKHNCKLEQTITALRAALAEPVQEPVAWQWLDSGNFRKAIPAKAMPSDWRPLYSAPPQRKPLSEDEQVKLAREMVKGNKSVEWLVRAIERAHGTTTNERK